MSFFSKLADKLDDMNIGGSEKEKPRDREGYLSHQGYPPPSQQYGGGGGGYNQQPYPPQYGGSPAPPPSGGYPGQDQGHYSSPPPQSTGPTYAPPQDKPPIPAGWVPQFDQQYQRWYYYEQATGRSQWEAPGYHAGSLGGDRDYGSHGDPSYGSPAPGYGYPSNDSHDYGGQGDQGYGHSGEAHGEYRGEEKKKKDHSGLLMGAAGGLSVGAIGGALLANALDDSDDEHHQAPAPVYAAPAPPPAPVYAEPVYEPAYNDEGEYVDASDRESVASAREEYEEALNDSSASSSDVEEAREEYYEEYEEAYED